MADVTRSSGFKIATLIFLLLALTSCQQGMPATKISNPDATLQVTATRTPTSAPVNTAAPIANSIPETGQAPIEPAITSHGLTHQGKDGNRVITGSGGFPFKEPVDLQLPGHATWLIATEVDDGIIWTAVLDDGRALSYRMNASGLIIDNPLLTELPPGMPPAAYSIGNNFHLIQVADPEQSLLTHPINLPGSGMRAYITQAGEIRFVDNNDKIVAALDVNALPDTRIMVDEQERLLLLSDPTDRYAHGVLGDSLEAASISLIETMHGPAVITTISVPENTVIEGIFPIWTDLTGDGQREIVVTVSDIEQGAGIAVLDESGTVIAEGPKIGTPYRWRHQIAVSNFDSLGGTDIAVVRTPHIAGTVEFYRLEDGKLSIAAEFPGITSHTIGSRNLDLAAAGDFNGDNFSELLVFTPDLTELIAIRKTLQGAEAAWQLPIGRPASSNIAGASLPGGQLVIGVARTDGVLRLWIPGN